MPRVSSHGNVAFFKKQVKEDELRMLYHQKFEMTALLN